MESENLSEKIEQTNSGLSTISENPLNSFRFFFFSKFWAAIERVEGVKFQPGKHLVRWCSTVQVYPRTSLKSARLHLKSTVAIAYLAWKIYRMTRGIGRRYNEWLYVGFKEDGAEYQIKRLKRYIAELPELYGSLVENTDAETKIDYISAFNPDAPMRFVVTATGMFTFKRGEHPDGIIADDILRDPQVKLDISQLKKLEKIFFEELEPMPKKDVGEIHVFGTAQDENDLFTVLEEGGEYKCIEAPAVIDDVKQIVLWPEGFPYPELQKYKKRMGEKSFNKEFQCRAVRSEDSYFKAEQIDGLTWRRLRNYSPVKAMIGGERVYRDGEVVRLNEWSYGGFDIGKKRHPSHLFVICPDRQKRLIQLCSAFLDGWEYKDQLVFLRSAIKYFRIAKLMYDDTRAEFEYMREAGSLPEEMEGVAFTAKSKYSMATEVDSIVTEKAIRFVADPRQKRQMLTVDNDLKAVQTDEGHGDCFFSLCLAVRAYKEGQGLGVFEI